MRRATMTAAIAVAVLAGLATAATEASAEARLLDSGTTRSSGANQQEMREKQCRFQWVDPRTWTPKEERRTAQCVVGRWSVPGGLETFDRIIDCESGWYRLAYNPAGFVGLGQHSLMAWPGRVRTYSPPLWHLNPGWKNSRTMLTVTARMMHAVGLSPWACA